MVIMALLPKSADMAPSRADQSKEKSETLAITTPDALPEAIAGRPYVVALAARGGQGPLRWSIDGTLPEGLSFASKDARIEGTPRAGTAKPVSLVLHVSDAAARASQPTKLVVYQSDHPLTTPSRWDPGLPPIPLRSWLEQGIGFLVLWLVHSVGMNAIASLERRSQLAEDDQDDSEEASKTARLRFSIYRLTVRLATLSATLALGV